MRHIVGIDEVGRGPLAGPVAVGVVSIPGRLSKKFFRNIKDSKKLSEEKREEWYKKALGAKRRGQLDFAVSLVGERVIDKMGINYAIRFGIEKSLEKLRVSNNSKILLDGGLKAPTKFRNQKTIIKGDEKKQIIALASIVAKVTRDRKMVVLSKKFPKYSLEKNKGYGTKRHIKTIKKFGPTNIHRKSFLTRLTK